METAPLVSIKPVTALVAKSAANIGKVEYFPERKLQTALD
jgi:hypothetical protein